MKRNSRLLGHTDYNQTYGLGTKTTRAMQQGWSERRYSIQSATKKVFMFMFVENQNQLKHQEYETRI